MIQAADNGSFADSGANAGVADIVGSGVGRDNDGNSSTSQQQANGSGASNQNNVAQVNGSGPHGRRAEERRRRLHRPLVSRSRAGRGPRVGGCGRPGP
ncbi:hypothetical protein SBD_5587 [Streptomyces bottropensis ATCC 25435]|uniref:Uncharacterized protein n=1 Tax=Streptomyces bottropensis ATCC 25435 TaxID=1054862 RepID=M3E8P1_9ACTN|nr:hypothetical protein SBD_5587 [Streptomyces bottropensis ATCC 25435]